MGTRVHKALSLQLSRSSLVPEFIRRLVPEALDHIVAMVEANKPFLPLVKRDLGRRTEFYLHAPEVGGSSVLLVEDLSEVGKTEQSESKIILLTDDLDEEREAHFQKIFPELRKQTTRKRFSEVGTAGLDGDSVTEKVVFSINQAHLLSDRELVQQIREMMGKFDQILIGEGNNKSVRQVIGMLLLSPLVAIFTAPFVKPFKLSRIVLTYLIPILPLILAWDGIVALFKIRAPEKILALVEKELSSGRGSEAWKWTSGKSPNNRGGFVIYLYGKRK